MLQTLRWRQPLHMNGLYNQKMKACNGNLIVMKSALCTIMRKPKPVTLVAVVARLMPSERHLQAHCVALLTQLSPIFEPQCPLYITNKTIC